MAQTNFPSISANAVVYPLTITPLAVTVCNTDATKDSWILSNGGTCSVYVKYGTDCNPVVYTHKLSVGAILADNYGGIITACVDPSNSGLLLVTLKI